MDDYNKVILSKNLAFHMAQKGVDRSQLCDDLNFKYSTVSEWLSAKKYPRMDKIEMLANYFNINKSDLIEERSSKLTKIPYTEEGTVLVPVVGRVAAGYSCHAEENITEYIRTDGEVLKNGYNYFWLQVKGDSMQPSLMEGDFVLVQMQDTLDRECYAVVTIDNEDGLVKIVDIQSKKITLTSVNPYYPPRVFKKEEMNRVHVVGMVVQSMRRFL